MPHWTHACETWGPDAPPDGAAARAPVPQPLPAAALYVMPAGLPIWAPEGLGDWQFEHNLDCLRRHHAHLRRHHAMAARASRRHPEHLANAAACRRLIAALLPALRRYEADERAA